LTVGKKVVEADLERRLQCQYVLAAWRYPIRQFVPSE